MARQQPNPESVYPSLVHLAQHSLCRRDHQDQIPGMAQQWTVANRAAFPSGPPTGIASSAPPTQTNPQPLRSASSRASLASIPPSVAPRMLFHAPTRPVRSRPVLRTRVRSLRASASTSSRNTIFRNTNSVLAASSRTTTCYRPTERAVHVPARRGTKVQSHLVFTVVIKLPAMLFLILQLPLQIILMLLVVCAPLRS